MQRVVTCVFGDDERLIILYRSCMTNLSDPELLDPVVHLFARCRACQRLVLIQVKNGRPDMSERDCPHCGVRMTQFQILQSVAENTRNTQAVASAHKIASFNPAAIVVILANIILTAMGIFPGWFREYYVLLYTGPVLVILKWLHRYWWRCQVGDEEYIQAIRQMKLSLLLWVATLLLCASLLFI